MEASRGIVCAMGGSSKTGQPTYTMSAANKGTGQRPTTRASGGSTGSGNKQVVYTLLASAAAGVATWYYSFIHTPASFTVLPASYALCADAGKIYTVDPSKPNVDCIVVDKQTILTSGTLCRSSFYDCSAWSLTTITSGGPVLVGRLPE